MSIYNGITPQGYLIMVLASFGAILYVGVTVRQQVLRIPRDLTMGGGARYWARLHSSVITGRRSPPVAFSSAISQPRNRQRVRELAPQASF
jgi:hypothetical protein